jgi:hypothetical protein
MKRLLPLFYIFVVLFASAGVASADQPQPGTFTITGYTDPSSVQVEYLPSGRAKFELLALGSVAGNPFDSGVFQFEERGNVDLTSGEGTNHGVMTITVADGQAVIGFDGKTDGILVNGNWRVISGSGSYEKLHGQGKYTGDAGYVFSVTFDGEFS